MIKKFSKLVNKSQSYVQEYSVLFFLTQGAYLLFETVLLGL